MKTILFDNIIYSLQHVGGISSQWAMLQNGLFHNSEVNLLFLERKDAVNNLYRKSIDVPCEKIVEPVCKYPLIIDRYRNVDVNNIDLDIFHSSYYRCANSKDVRSVVTVHDFTYERFMTGLRRNVHCKQKYNAIIKAEVVVCVSENTKRDLLYYLPETNKNKVTKPNINIIIL